MIWHPTTVAHLNGIDLRGDQLGSDVRGAIPDTEATAAILRETARTLLSDAGEPLAAFGLLRVSDGVLGAWGAVGEKAMKFPVELARGTRNWLQYGAVLFEAHRVQATARCDVPYLGRWMDFLGMTWEGRLHQYGADRSDHDLYARTFP